MTSKLEDHAHKVHDRDLLNEQVVKLQSEIQIAQATVAEKVRHQYYLRFLLLQLYDGE